MLFKFGSKVDAFNCDNYYLGRNDNDYYAYNVDSSLKHQSYPKKLQSFDPLVHFVLNTGFCISLAKQGVSCYKYDYVPQDCVAHTCNV